MNTNESVSRRGILKRLAAALTGAGLATLAGGRAQEAFAETTDTDFIATGGQQQDGSPIPTGFDASNPGAGFLTAVSGTGRVAGVLGRSSDAGVLDCNARNVGVAGIGTDAGVHGHSDTGFGLFGETGEAAGANLPKGLDELTFGAGGRGDAGGLLGIGGEVGVMDCNAYGTGVLAAGSSYGAMLQGGLAPLHLTPANISGRPQSGSYMKGDIFVDSSARLFVCVADGKPGTWVEVLTRPAQK